MDATRKYYNYAIVKKILKDIKRARAVCPNCGGELNPMGVCMRCGYCGG